MLIDFLVNEKIERRKRITPLQKDLLDIVEFYFHVVNLPTFQDNDLECSYPKVKIKYKNNWYILMCKYPMNTAECYNSYQPEVDYDRSQVTFHTEEGKLDLYVNGNFNLEIEITLNLSTVEIKELIQHTKQVLSEKVNKERNIFKSQKESKIKLGKQLECLYETK